MSVGVTLLACALLGAQIVPAGLWRAHRARVDPLVIIAGWALTACAVLACALAGLALVVMSHHGEEPGLVSGIVDCWSALLSGASPSVDHAGGVLGMIAAVAVVCRLAVGVRRELRRRAQSRMDRIAVLRLAGRVDEGSPTTLWLAHDEPLAFSLAGRPGVVVATDGLLAHLTPTEVAAILEHERAHLRGRHHALITGADLLGALAPLRLFRDLPAAARELAELAADADAAARHGAPAIHAALLRVNARAASDGELATHATSELRLSRLREPLVLGLGGRMASRGIVGSAMAIAQAMLGAAVLLAAAGMGCAIV
jgi:beta-lactamase regulating signal transducer with metallopeptidase domain